MNISLRNKYFGWLVWLLLIVYFLLLAVMVFMEARESIVEQGNFSAEYDEIIAFASVVLLTLPAGIFFAWHIAGRLLAPLRSVLKTAERIRSGNLNERIPEIKDDDELSKLALAINDAFDRYAGSVRRLEMFSADASHQLRTPLAAIKLSAEVALQRDRSAAEYREALAEIVDQSDRLNQTVSQLLLLARMNESVKKDFTMLSPGSLIRKWAAELAPVSDSVQISYHETPDVGGLRVNGNEVLLRQCFDNLLNNAIGILPDGGQIVISLRAVGRSGLEWQVEDSGPGIPAADLPFIFDRFYQSRNRATGGSGLGLSIVREIIFLHGGTVQAGQSSSLGGAALTIRLPAEMLSR